MGAAQKVGPSLTSSLRLNPGQPKTLPAPLAPAPGLRCSLVPGAAERPGGEACCSHAMGEQDVVGKSSLGHSERLGKYLLVTGA